MSTLAAPKDGSLPPGITSWSVIELQSVRLFTLPTSSGLANTDLDLILKRHGIERVIVSGLRANTCIDSTVRSAAELGYDVTLVTDAVAAFSQAAIDATVRLNALSYARVIPTAELVQALDPGT
jgi:nicotinamidase-related amidase